jgi:hypothetical protein
VNAADDWLRYFDAKPGEDRHEGRPKRLELLLGVLAAG